MNEFGKLSEEEIQNLEFGLDQAITDLHNEEARGDLFSNPLRYLKRFGIKILKYIDRIDIQRRFIRSVREVLSKLDGMFNACLRCNLAILIIMHSMLGGAGIAWSGFIHLLGEFMNNLSEFFKKSKSSLAPVIVWISDRLDEYKPSQIAFKICESMDYCVQDHINH